MALRRSKPIPWTPIGLSDAISADLGFPGCMLSLQNLVPDPGSKTLWQCRPAAQRLTNFPSSSNPGFISAQLVIGTRIYGMISTSRNPGCDEPFVYDISSGKFVAVSGVSPANVPVSPPSSGNWVPPVMALIGGVIIVTHPGFNIGLGNFFGVLNINNPAVPVWSAGTLTGAVTLPAKPISVALFSGRAWYAVENALVFSDTDNPTNCTSGAQVITLGTNQSIVAIAGVPLINQVQGGIVQSLTAFTTSELIYQVTGDAALSTLALNELEVETGTYSQNSVCSTPQGLCFVSPEGVRFVAQSGIISDPLGVGGQGVIRPFFNVSIPSRVAVGYAGDTIRFSVPSSSSGNAPNEFFYHLSKKVWSGPHTFPDSLIQGYGSSFIITPVAVTGALYTANVIASVTDDYIENNASMSWGISTPLLPPTSDMAMHEVIEQTIELAISTSDDYTFSFVDEQGNSLATTTVHSTTSASLWGTAIWGISYWGGAAVNYATTQLTYTLPVVFKQAFFRGSGASSSSFRIGHISSRLRELGYVLPFASVS